MSLPAAPLVPAANNPQSVGHADAVVAGSLTVAGNLQVAGTITAPSEALTSLSLVTTAPASTTTLAPGNGTNAPLNSLLVSTPLTVSGALTAPAYRSVVLPGTLIPAVSTPLGPTFLRPCLVVVSVLATTTPTGTGGIGQNRQIIVSLTFTNTGANQLTDFVLSDTFPGAASNIGYSFSPSTGRFSFSNNAAPIEATTISFAILNQA